MLGLDVVHCSGCTGEPSTAPSPQPLPVMAEVRLVCVGQRALCHGHHEQPLIGYMVPGGSSFQQQFLASEGSQPRSSRGMPTSESSPGGESRLSGGVVLVWST